MNDGSCNGERMDEQIKTLIICFIEKAEKLASLPDFLPVKKDGETTKVNLRYLIGADGATSRVRKTVTSRSPARYFTLQEWIQPRNPKLVTNFVGIVEQDIDFYTWLVPKDELLIIGTAYNSNGKTSKQDLNLLPRKSKKNWESREKL